MLQLGLKGLILIIIRVFKTSSHTQQIFMTIVR